MTVPVTDHAVLRYLERVMGLDVEGLRTIIGQAVEKHSDAPCVRVLRARFLLTDGVVVTVIDDATVPHYETLVQLTRPPASRQDRRHRR